MKVNNDDSGSRSIKILGFKPSAAFFKPGETVNIGIEIDCNKSTHAQLVTSVCHLSAEVYRSESQVNLIEGRQLIVFSWKPPPKHPHGYGLEVWIEAQAGFLPASSSTAFDVLEHWTEFPRYGFLCEYGQGRADIDTTIARLVTYHVNGLQFYDWMYRHEQLLTQEEPYLDILGRKLSRRTIDCLIGESHKYNIAAMLYSSVYGCSLAFERQHPEWSLCDEHQRPILFGEDFMAIMDPSPDSAWTSHLIDQFTEVLLRSEFDGIHLDQYGDPKYGWNAMGHPVDVGDAIVDFISTTRRRVDAYRENGAVVFNLVNNWPVEKVATSPQNFIYIEVWPPHDTYADLYHLTINAQILSSGKPVVIALYIDGSFKGNHLLADSILFASGASRIELGEGREDLPGLLTDPYFPKYSKLDSELGRAIARLYDFAVRYQEVTGPVTHPPDDSENISVFIDDLPLRLGAANTVWPILRLGPTFLAINLINLTGLGTMAWKEELIYAPIRLSNLTVRVSGLSNHAKRVWYASPDSVNQSATIVPFHQAGESITCELPSLDRWTLVVVEWSDLS